MNPRTSWWIAALVVSSSLLSTSAAAGIDAVQGQPATPSGRLRIEGTGFGASQGSSLIRVAGLQAIVTQWTDKTLIAYVPESTPPGAALLELVMAGQVTETTTITVVPRIPDGHVKWRFAVDADYMRHRPGVAPDGSIYVNDVKGRLYKLTPDGGLVWVVDALRGQVGQGAEGPVVVGTDGRVYVTVNPLGPPVELVAYDPNGSLAWVFTEPNALSTAVGPAVGPDGNVYVAFHGPATPSRGICSLTPNGVLRWNNPGQPIFYEEGGIGAEFAFGSSQLGGSVDQVLMTVDLNGGDHMYAFDMANGSQNWSVLTGAGNSIFMQFQGEVATGPDGTVYRTEFLGLGGIGWRLTAFEPNDGSNRWSFDPNILSESSRPVVGGNGVIYFGWDLSRVSAVSPSGSAVWTYTDFVDGVRGPPQPSPNHDVVLFGGGNFGQPGVIKALDAGNGGELWRVDLPKENGDVIPEARALFTADGATAYYPTLTLNDPPGFQVSYLYALDVYDICQPNLGFGGPGGAVLTVCGETLESGNSADLTLTSAPPNSVAWLIAAANRSPQPFMGGTLVPLPSQLVWPTLTDATGSVGIPNVPGGGGLLDVYVQFAIQDPSQPSGVGLSNAVKLEFMP